MPSIQLWQDSPSRRIREKKWCEPVAKPRRSCRILKGTMTIKKICSALKCQFSPAGQTLIQPLLEPKQVKASPASQGTRWFAGGDVLTAHAEIYVDAGLFMTFVTLLSARLRTKCRTFFFLVKRRPTAKKQTPTHKSDSTTTPATQSTFNDTFGHSSAPPDTRKTEIQAKCRTCYVTNLMLIRKIYQCSLYCLSYVKFDVRPWPKVISYINSWNLYISI